LARGATLASNDKGASEIRQSISAHHAKTRDAG
jgi:hypothetical protein